MTRFTVHDLEEVIAQRASASADVSYTRKLLDRGPSYCARKMGEEAVETVIATLQDDRAAFVAECADLTYHLLVLLHAKGVPLSDIEAELANRTKMSGLAEKASRAGKS